MEIARILAELDQEISRLQEARRLLAGLSGNAVTVKRKPGRPAGKGQLSPQARKRIAEAMRKSWAARKKARSGNLKLIAKQ